MSETEQYPPLGALGASAQITAADQSVDRVMGKVVALAKSTLNLDGAVSVTVIEDGRPFTIASTGSLAIALDERQYERGDGPCLRCIEAGEPLMVTDMHTERRWSDWARSASSAGAGSSLSIPLALHGEISAALNLYSTERDAFDATSVELASTFAAYAVVGRVHLYTAQRQVADQLQTVMQSQAVIEQAKGILIGQRQCSPEEAFGILVRRGQDSNRTLRDMAEVLVSEARSRNR